MIAIVVAVGIALQFRTSQTLKRDDEFFASLERRVAEAVASAGFVLAKKEYQPESFGHRVWHFQRSDTQVQIFWDGKERDVSVMLHAVPKGSTPTEETRCSLPLSSAQDRYASALERVVSAAREATRKGA